jgi:hypothetical protein
VRDRLARSGRLVVVEYDADRGNPWVPHPFSFGTWRQEAARAGFATVALIHRVPSRFLGAIYGSVAIVAAVDDGSMHDPAVLHSRPDGDDREE